MATPAFACRSVLTGPSRLNFVSVPDGPVSCEHPETCTVLAQAQAQFQTGEATLVLDQHPCFDASGNNVDRCCTPSGCSSWVGAGVETLECVDTGIVRLSYSLPVDAVVSAPLVEWPLPAGSGRISVVRTLEWTAVVNGGKVVHNETRRDSAAIPVRQILRTGTGSAPFYQIVSRPPGIGESGNSGVQRFRSAAGLTRGTDGSVLFKNNASRIHLTTEDSTLGHCSPCARSPPGLSVVRIATNDELARATLVFAATATYTIRDISFETLSELERILSDGQEGVTGATKRELVDVPFAPYAELLHVTSGSGRAGAQPPSPPPPIASHVATLALNGSWGASELSHRISSSVLAPVDVSVYPCTVATFAASFGDRFAEIVAAASRVSDVGIDCGMTSCAYIIGRGDVRRSTIERAIPPGVQFTFLQSSCAAISISTHASDERVMAALSGIPGTIAAVTVIVTVPQDENQRWDTGAWWVWLIAALSFLTIAAIVAYPWCFTAKPSYGPAAPSAKKHLRL